MNETLEQQQSVEQMADGVPEEVTGEMSERRLEVKQVSAIPGRSARKNGRN